MILGIMGNSVIEETIENIQKVYLTDTLPSVKIPPF